MEADTQAQVAFFLTGRRPSEFLDAVDGLQLRPALFAGYRDLTPLRYDFPLVLAAKSAHASGVESLSAVFDSALAATAKNAEADRIRKHGLRLEQEIRALLASTTTGSLSVVWDLAVSRLTPKMDPAFVDSCKRLRAAVKLDGEVVDCDATLPSRLVRHVWNAAQAQKTASFGKKVGQLVLKLSDILKSDVERSSKRLTAARLQASVGGAHTAMFDFDVMSRFLVKVQPKQGMPEERRARIAGLVQVLEKQRFVPVTAGKGEAVKPYEFVFENCADALKAYRERLPQLVALSKAVVIAELEIGGEYNPARHDAMFEAYGAAGLDAKELASFPDYLVCLRAGKLDAQEHGRLLEALSSGWPIKVLLQIDDLHDEAAPGQGAFATGLRASQLA